MSRYLARKAAFFHTHTWNKTFGEKVGAFPKFNPKNTERYKRAGLFMRILMKEFKMKNFTNRPIYRGVSPYEWKNLFHEGRTKMTRNNFTSFTSKFDVAHTFADESKVILEFRGSTPVIEYDDVRYLSLYSEDEILFPPGTFTVYTKGPIRMRGKARIYSVHFTPKSNVNFEALEKRANIRFRNRYVKMSKTSNNNKNKMNMNMAWKIMKANNLNMLRQKILYENLGKLNIIERKIRALPNRDQKKLDMIKKMKNRLLNLEKKTQIRKNKIMH